MSSAFIDIPGEQQAAESRHWYEMMQEEAHD
jgi:hypothetical protein